MHLTSVWHKIDVIEVSFLWFWCHLPMITDVIIMKMLSLSLLGHKKWSSKGFISLWNFFLCGYSVCIDVFAWVSTWENIFSTCENRNGFQLGRITLDFSKHWFCGNKIGYKTFNLPNDCNHQTFCEYCVCTGWFSESHFSKNQLCPILSLSAL